VQEALWKLDVARQRAATWGFNMLVPIGRINRGIQTQAGEIWASTGAITMQTATATHVHTARGTEGFTAAAAATSTAVYSTSSSSRALVTLGDDLSADAEPGSAAATKSGIQRKTPAFTQHNSTSSGRVEPRQSVANADAGKGAAASEGSILAAAQQLVSAGDVQLLPLGDLLKLIASLYSAKAAADARALRSHTPPLSMWGFLLRQLLGPGSSGGGSSGGGSSSAGGVVDQQLQSDVVTAVAQLLSSAQAHAAANKEVAAFHAALLDSLPGSQADTAGSSPRCSMGRARLSAGAGCGGSSSGSTTPRASGSGLHSGVAFRGTWGEVRHLCPCAGTLGQLVWAFWLENSLPVMPCPVETSPCS
jgi:hypothetical protein